MTPQELRNRRILAFRQLAADELGAARVLEKGHGTQSAYFLQQSVEKLARGPLEILDVRVGPTHNIQQLAGMMKDKPEWSVAFVALDELSVAATRYRYPGPKGNVSAIDAGRLSFLLVAVERLNEEFGAILVAAARND